MSGPRFWNRWRPWQKIRDQVDSKFVSRKGDSGDHHSGLFEQKKEPLRNSYAYPNRARTDGMMLWFMMALGTVDS